MAATLEKNQEVLTDEPHAFRWTADEYEKLTEYGVFNDRRVQLLEGEIVEMAAMNSPHRVAMLKTGAALQRALPTKLIQAQMPMRIGNSEPEPDYAVLTGSVDDYLDSHPEKALLIVEVSDTTLREDQGRKARIYASANIAEYWILNLKTRELEVLREPASGAYTLKRSLNEDEKVSPLLAPETQIAVADMLPPVQTP